MKIYECYIVKDESGRVVYVGEGVQGRHKHVNSGISHVYELNKRHFEKHIWDVHVQQCGSKTQAQDMELALIHEHNPEFNVHNTSTRDFRKKITKLRKNLTDVVELKPDKVIEKTAILYGLLSCHLTGGGDIKVRRHVFEIEVKPFIDEYGIRASPNKIYNRLTHLLRKPTGSIRKTIINHYWIEDDCVVIELNWKLIEDYGERSFTREYMR